MQTFSMVMLHWLVIASVRSRFSVTAPSLIDAAAPSRSRLMQAKTLGVLPPEHTFFGFVTSRPLWPLPLLGKHHGELHTTVSRRRELSAPSAAGQVTFSIVATAFSEQVAQWMSTLTILQLGGSEVGVIAKAEGHGLAASLMTVMLMVALLPSR